MLEMAKKRAATSMNPAKRIERCRRKSDGNRNAWLGRDRVGIPRSGIGRGAARARSLTVKLAGAADNTEWSPVTLTRLTVGGWKDGVSPIPIQMILTENSDDLEMPETQ